MKSRQAKAAACSVATVHMLFIVVMLASLPLVFLFEWYKYIALGLLAGIFLAWMMWNFDCPLTVIENSFRRQYGAEQLKPDFISYHLRKTFGMSFSTRIVWFSVYAYLAAILLAVILNIYHLSGGTS